jgi:acetyl-CoA acetyltransferase family protein
MRVAIVGGVRTPFVRAGGVFSRLSALDLGKHVVVSCVERLGFDAALLEELYFGTVLLDPRIPNLAREIVLRTGLPKGINGHFVSNNCATGILAAGIACEAIQAGRIQCALAGGSESMSQPTLTFPRQAEEFFLRLSRKKGFAAKLPLLRSFRPRFLAPQAPSPKEPSTGLTMGQHCELMAQEFLISRAAQDEVALGSHQRAAAARAAGVLDAQIVALGDVREDNILRLDVSAERLAELPAVFDRSQRGTISAGNSSALTDGASVVCLTSESFAKAHRLRVLGYIEGVEYASVQPGDGLLMAPALALPRLLQRLQLRSFQIDLFEVHEAFAAQVLCNLHAWEKGWSRAPEIEPLGAISRDRINVYGGSLALGHPFAATGGRLLLNICHALERNNLTRGALSVCAAGGGAAAMVVSRSPGGVSDDL